MSSGPLPRIVAVVVTFNRLELLERLVRRLGEVDALAEVLVVDNASTDGTGEWLAARETTRPESTLLQAQSQNVSLPATASWLGERAWACGMARACRPWQAGWILPRTAPPGA